jgi:hypothetical protein
MKYGAISVKYISYFLKINMLYKYENGRSQNSYLFLGTSFAILFDKYKTIFCWILIWKLSRMIENGLTKKINPNTNILNSVINAVQTFK